MISVLLHGFLSTLLLFEFLISDQESPIVSVLSSTENPSLIFIVHQNSITESWEFTQSNYKWIKRNEFQLSNTKGVEVLHVILHPLVNSFFWCERRSSSVSNLTTCCVCLREVTVSERLGNNTAVSVGPLVAILHGCPSMSLHVLGRSVGMVPDFPEELKNIILFWTFIQRSLKVGQSLKLFCPCVNVKPECGRGGCRQLSGILTIFLAPSSVI